MTPMLIIIISKGLVRVIVHNYVFVCWHVFVSVLLTISFTNVQLFSTDRFKESVIEERRISSERLLVFASRNIHLVTCAPFISFIKVSKTLIKGLRGCTARLTTKRPQNVFQRQFKKSIMFHIS